MKQVKRKRKNAPAATSVAEPAMTIADANEPLESVDVSASASTSSFVLGAACTIRESMAMKSDLLKLLNVQDTVVIDVRAVERVDTAGLQLLCAFVRDRRVQGRRTRWTGNPQPFTEAVEMLGLTQALGFSSEVSI